MVIRFTNIYSFLIERDEKKKKKSFRGSLQTRDRWFAKRRVASVAEAVAAKQQRFFQYSYFMYANAIFGSTRRFKIQFSKVVYV